MGTVNGSAVRTRLAVYGGKTYLGLTREVREIAGLEVGDRVVVVLERDEDAQRAATRDARIAKTLTMLAGGVEHP